MSAKPASSFTASLETSVPVSRSVDHIRAAVERFGAVEFSTQYDPETGRPVAIAFRIRDKRLGRALPVALRAPVESLVPLVRNWRVSWPDDKVREQAERVAWRNLYDFVRASLIAVETGIMSLGEAFMANLVITLPTGEAKRFGELAASGQLVRPDEQGRLLLRSGS